MPNKIALPHPDLGHLPAEQVHIWHVPLTVLTPYTSYLLSLLSDEARESYQRARQYQSHPPQLASRALLRLLLARYVNTEPQTLIMTHCEHGKPALRDYPWLQYSVSHTKTDVVFALTCHHRVGIDIEMLRSTKDYLDLAKRFFSSEEYHYLSQLSEEAISQAFISMWTVKEAFVKAVGFGLSYPLSDFTVIFTHEKPSIAYKTQIKESSLASDWQCHAWSLTEDCLMALVTEGQTKSILFGLLDVDTLCQTQ